MDTATLIPPDIYSYFPAFKQATLERVRAQGGIIGWTATTEDVLAGLKTLRKE